MREGPKSVNEIQRRVGISWETVSKVLRMLETIGVVKKEEAGKEHIYFLISTPVSGEDCYFSVALGKEVEDELRKLYGTIKRKWYEVAGAYPDAIQVQKTAVHVIKELGLNLPVGRFKYGLITPLKYRQDEEYPELKGERKKQVEEIVEKLAKKYGRLPSWKMVEDQHKEEGLLFYEYWARLLVSLERDLKTARSLLVKLLEVVKNRGSSELLSRLYGLITLAEDDIIPRSVLPIIAEEIKSYTEAAEFYEDMRRFGLLDAQLWHLLTWLKEKEDIIEELVSSVLPSVEIDKAVEASLKDLAS